MRFELAPHNRGADDEVLLEDLRVVSRSRGRDWVSRDEYEQVGRFHPKTLVNRFGSWNKALQRAGLRVRKPNWISKEECLDDLRRVAALLNKSVVTVSEYRQFGRFSEAPFGRIFGGLVAALCEAGLAPSQSFRERLSEEELFQNLEVAWRTLGRQPKRDEMRSPLSIVGADTYRRRFGSWRKALEAFVEFATCQPVDQQAILANREESPSSIKITPSGNRGEWPRTPRTVSWRLRFLVMRRDCYKCRICGVSPAMSPGVILEVDHVIAWGEGGETVLENLQTLSQRCNGGKSDLAMNLDAR